MKITFLVLILAFHLADGTYSYGYRHQYRPFPRPFPRPFRRPVPRSRPLSPPSPDPTPYPEHTPSPEPIPRFRTFPPPTLEPSLRSPCDWSRDIRQLFDNFESLWGQGRMADLVTMLMSVEPFRLPPTGGSQKKDPNAIIATYNGFFNSGDTKVEEFLDEIVQTCGCKSAIVLYRWRITNVNGRQEGAPGVYVFERKEGRIRIKLDIWKPSEVFVEAS